ncbi:MAG: tRNA (adenosine(37)-N6)-threonylcarbamoyltransferase complex dimerization subunit type 1 TsaB [Leptonema sp. (in: bacteria)]
MNDLLEFYKTKKELKVLILDNSSLWLYCAMYDIEIQENPFSYRIQKQKSFSEYSYQNSFQKLAIYLQVLFDTFSNLDLILCGNGPGSFTGVRIAVSTARNLSQFLNIPVILIDSLTLYSYAFYKDFNLNHFLLGFDAKQNKVYVKEFTLNHLLNSEIYDIPIEHLQKMVTQKEIVLFIDNPNIFKNDFSLKQSLPMLNTKYMLDIIFYEDFVLNLSGFFKKNYKEILPIYLRKDPATEKYPKGFKRI